MKDFLFSLFSHISSMVMTYVRSVLSSRVTLFANWSSSALPWTPTCSACSQTITWTWHLCLKHWYIVRNSACLFNSWIHLSVLLFLNLFSSWFPSVKIIQNVFSYWLLDLTDRKRLQWITDLTLFSSQFRICCCCSQLFCIFKAVEIFFSFCSVWVFLFGFVLYFENWHFCQWQRLIWTITFCWCVCNL